jgi:hypothetical protein
VQKIGSRQQMRIVASYADGKTRDVTAETFIESGNTDARRRFHRSHCHPAARRSAQLARYEGNYAATTVTVMGDHSSFVWKERPPGTSWTNSSPRSGSG